MPSRKTWEAGLEKISEKVWPGRQSWEYESIWTVRGQKVKIRIDRDAYDFQSSATAYIYDPNERKWNVLASLPTPMMQSLQISHVTRPADFHSRNSVSFFHADEDNLIKEAQLILRTE